MLRNLSLLLLFFLPIAVFAQEELKIRNNAGGLFSLGVRSTISVFDKGGVGTGAGGQFRLQILDRVNTEWYADYMTSEIGNSGNRTDMHIGWSVMYYPLKDRTYKKLMKPYVVMGHCFDYTKVAENANPDNSFDKWSSAIQLGVGNHFNITEHFDISLIAQYMFHLGKHVEGYETENGFEIRSDSGLGLEGHLLFTVGMNYKIADLW